LSRKRRTGKQKTFKKREWKSERREEVVGGRRKDHLPPKKSVSYLLLHMDGKTGKNSITCGRGKEDLPSREAKMLWEKRKKEAG